MNLWKQNGVHTVYPLNWCTGLMKIKNIPDLDVVCFFLQRILCILSILQFDSSCTDAASPHWFTAYFSSCFFCLKHLFQTQGPRAKCGPPRHLMWPLFSLYLILTLLFWQWIQHTWVSEAYISTDGRGGKIVHQAPEGGFCLSIPQ